MKFNCIRFLSKFIWAVITFFLVSNCHKNDNDPIIPLSIISFSPTSGPEGTTVIIEGTNFSSIAAENIVRFNGTTAQVQAATTTHLTAIVPEGATTGQINITTNGKVVTSSGNFEVIEISPIISSFAPSSGTIGSMVMITGTHFSTTLSENEVKFNGTTALITSVTATQITTIVPTGATSGKVTVKVKQSTVSSATDFLIIPLLTSFSPDSGSPGTIVQITGTGFSLNTADNIIKFNGITAMTSSATATQLLSIVPAGAVTGQITITINGVTVESMMDFIVPAPEITSFSPTYGIPGSSITINGSNFGTINSSLNKVTFISNAGGEANAVITDIRDTQLKVIIPSDAKAGKIKAVIGSGTVTSVDEFEVLKDFPRDGLVAFYPFSGNGNDASSNHLNGTLANHNGDNGPDLATDRFGKTSQAIFFDGGADYFKVVNTPALQISSKITIGVWVKVSSARNQYLLSKQSDNSGCKGYSYSFAKDGTVTDQTNIFGSTENASIYFSHVSFINLNEWVFLAFTVDGSTATAYLNDEAGKSNDVTIQSLLDCSADLIVGGSPTWDISITQTQTFLGLIDDLAIYNRVLSHDEILKLFQQTVTKY
jgi:hypothetical protein